ncbi:MAG: hypothetical protein QW343_00935 [Candidatus Norongarragalinales archaeon]
MFLVAIVFSKKRKRGRRGQLLSVDFLVASALLAVCVGVLLQYNEFLQSNAATAALVADNKAEAIAALLHSSEQQRIPREAVYCARRVLASGETQRIAGDCDAFSCGRVVFSARRIEACVPSPSPAITPAPSPAPSPLPSPALEACVLEVRTCS